MRSWTEPGSTASDVRVDAEGRLVNKEQIKAKLRPHYWELYDATLGELAGGVPVRGHPRWSS